MRVLVAANADLGVRLVEIDHPVSERMVDPIVGSDALDALPNSARREAMLPRRREDERLCKPNERDEWLMAALRKRCDEGVSWVVGMYPTAESAFRNV